MNKLETWPCVLKCKCSVQGRKKKKKKNEGLRQNTFSSYTVNDLIKALSLIRASRPFKAPDMV